MLNFIDIIGIIIVLVSAIFAYKKGFVKTFFSFISTFVALILAFTLCNAGVEILKSNTGIDEWLEKTITTSLNSNIEEKQNEETTQNEKDNSISKVLETLPQNMQNVMGLEEYKENAKITIIENSVEIILKVLSWVIIYFGARIILLIVCIVCDGIMSIPFLKQINNLAGLAVGFILGLFRVYLILAFVSFLTSVVSMNAIVDLIKNSMIISLMYENNILLSLIF